MHDSATEHSDYSKGYGPGERRALGVTYLLSRDPVIWWHWEAIEP